MMKCCSVVPVYSIAREINFFSSPKGGFGLLIHPPDVIVLDGEEDEGSGARLPLFSAFLWCETFRFDGGEVFTVFLVVEG